MITSRDVVALGLSRTMLGKYVQNGLLVRVSRGIYVVQAAIPDELFALAKQCDRFVFSHATAAFLHGISDRTPFEHTVSIRSSQTISRALRTKLACFYVKDAIFSLGQVTSSPVMTWNGRFATWLGTGSGWTMRRSFQSSRTMRLPIGRICPNLVIMRK